MLERLTDNFLSLLRREPIAKRDLEIASAPPGSAAGQRSSAGSLPLWRCDNRSFANTKGSVLWQEQAPATPGDIGFASSATALRSFNDESRMSNAFRLSDNQKVRLPALPRVSYGRQTFSKLRLLPFSFFLLVRVARLLFRTGTRPGTAEKRYKQRRNQN